MKRIGLIVVVAALVLGGTSCVGGKGCKPM